MAADQYLQAAAGQLESAATAVKSEMDQLRAEFMTYERDVKNSINDKEMQLHATNAKLLRDQPPETNVSLQLLIRKIQSDIDNLKKDLEQRKRQLNDTVRSKEAAVNDLMNESRGLQNKAARFK